MIITVLLLLIVVVIPMLFITLHYVYDISKNFIKGKRYNRSFKKIIGKSGLIILPFFIKDEQYNFLIDTGASKSIIDKEFASRFEQKKSKYKVSGFTGNSKSTNIVSLSLRYVDKYFNNDFVVTDISSVRNEIYKKSNIDIVGVVGNDIIVDNKIVIDFNDKRIYL